MQVNQATLSVTSRHQPAHAPFPPAALEFFFFSCWLPLLLLAFPFWRPAAARLADLAPARPPARTLLHPASSPRASVPQSLRASGGWPPPPLPLPLPLPYCAALGRVESSCTFTTKSHSLSLSSFSTLICSSPAIPASFAGLICFIPPYLSPFHASNPIQLCSSLVHSIPYPSLLCHPPPSSPSDSPSINLSVSLPPTSSPPICSIFSRTATSHQDLEPHSLPVLSRHIS